MIQQSMVLHSIVINRILIGVGVVWFLCASLVCYIGYNTKGREMIHYAEWMFFKHIGRLAMILFIAGLLALLALLIKALFFTVLIIW